MVIYFIIDAVQGAVNTQQVWFTIPGQPPHMIPTPPLLPPMSHFIEALTWEPDDIPYVYLDTGQRIGGPFLRRDPTVEESGSLTPSTTTITNAGARHLALTLNPNIVRPALRTSTPHEHRR